jgi:hypothetical protein
MKARLSLATSNENISLTSVVASIALIPYQSVRGDNDIGFFSPFQDLPGREPAKEEDNKVELWVCFGSGPFVVISDLARCS